MPKIKQWSSEDRERALHWVERKAKTGTVFRGHSGSVEGEIAALASITAPQALADHLRDALTADAWKRLMNALRQRKHASKTDAGEQISTPTPTPTPETKTDKAIRKFHDAVNRLDHALSDLVKTGAILSMRNEALEDAARGVDLFGPHSGTSIDVSGRVLRILCSPAISDNVPVLDDGTTHIREGAIQLRIELEPVKDVRRHRAPGAGLSNSKPEPDTWENCAVRIMEYVEKHST